VLRRLPAMRERVLPNGWVDVLRQVALFGGAYLLYRLVEGAVSHKSAVAFAHARDLISLERTLGIFVEQRLQSWASGSHLLMEIATYVYINAQTTILVGLLLYLYIAHNQQLLLRAQHAVRGDGDRADRLRLLPHRAAALPAQLGLRRHRLLGHRHLGTDQRRRQRVLQSLRGGAVDARRLRRDDRLDARPPGAEPDRPRLVGLWPA
jgi:hypothetical protein